MDVHRRDRGVIRYGGGLHPLYGRILSFFIPPIDPTLQLGAEDGANWLHVREQILTAILRFATLLGVIAFGFTFPPVLALGLWPLGLFYLCCLSLILLFGIYRTIAYRLRAVAVLAIALLLALGELLSFGYTEDAYGFLTTFALLALLLFGSRTGVHALLLSTLLLLLGGLAQSAAFVIPLAFPMRVLTADMALATSILFLAGVGTIQGAMMVLLGHIEAAWHESQQMRNLLEQRVAERTQALAEAHEQVLAHNHFLRSLHNTTITLLQSRDCQELLQRIVEHACTTLDAPYGLLLLVEGEQLVVHAHTSNLMPQLGLRLGRDTSTFAWMAVDRRAPAVIDCYAAWAGRHPRHDALNLQAAVNLPILVGDQCLGVIAIARTIPGYVFRDDDLQRGQLFSQIAAVAIDNTNLYTTAIREIAERQSAEAALKQQNNELEAFAHMVAHDLRSPLLRLIGTTDLLLLVAELRTPPQLEQHLHEILNTSQKMNTILDSLLTLASVRMRRKVQMHPLDMAVIVHESIHQVQQLIGQTKAMIMLPAEWPSALGYAPWVEEIWVNYLSNALKYGGQPPLITLGAEILAEAGMARFWVQDNGPGVSPDQQQQIFRPFTRLEQVHIHGYGLGLSIVQQIATQLGGAVGLESSAHGSRFFFTLPLAVTDPV